MKKKITLAKHILLKICQKVIYMLLSTSPPDSACSRFKSARVPEVSKSCCIHSRNYTNLIFHLVLLWVFLLVPLSHPWNNCLMNFPSEDFSNHLFLDGFPSAVFQGTTVSVRCIGWKMAARLLAAYQCPELENSKPVSIWRKEKRAILQCVC